MFFSPPSFFWPPFFLPILYGPHDLLADGLGVLGAGPRSTLFPFFPFLDRGGGVQQAPIDVTTLFFLPPPRAGRLKNETRQ